MSNRENEGGGPETTTTPEPGIAADEARQLDLAVGGQALIEGVMMRSPRYLAMAVRTPEGRIVVRKKIFKSIIRKLPFLNIPVLRGGIFLVETMGLGIDALMFSADQAMSDDRVERREGTSWKDRLVMWGTIAVSFALSLAIFFYLPILLTDLIVPADAGSLPWNITDGVIRVIFFVLYLWGISLMPDMRRVFEYHGSEHLGIHAFEHGRPLTPEGTRGFTTLHPRCGTSFLFFVMLISIFVFALLGRPEDIGDRLQRLAFVPVIGGLAYEAIKLSGKYGKVWFLQPVIFPGLMLQKITTKRPDDSQLEVSMASLKAVLTPEADDFRERIYYELPPQSAPTEAAGREVGSVEDSA